jgi:8-oxo-dGTP pyrophosphatase MutT (NUDIX family)
MSVFIGRGSEGTMRINVEQIRRFLESFRRRELGKPDLKKAAVLMLFFPKGEDLYILLTKRTEDVEHHKGQISFPGGSRDEGDEDLVATALRESDEEIGLSRDAFQVLGLFDEYETPSGFAITPVIAYAPVLPPLRRNAIEVAAILEVPVSLFLDGQNERVEKRVRNGRVFDVYYYRYGDYEIWGATAAMLRAFLHTLRR